MTEEELPALLKETWTYACGCVVTENHETKSIRIVIGDHFDRRDCPVVRRLDHIPGEGPVLWYPPGQ